MLTEIDTGFFVIPGSIQSNVIIGLDLDWTLICPVGGALPRDADDWRILPQRLHYLKQFIDYNYTLVIFTNQGFKGKALTFVLERIEKFNTFLQSHNINPWFCVATKQDKYRKPNIGMFDYIKRQIPDLDLSLSIYIGDAAGRPGDHTDDDRLFAQNCNLTFYVPEQVFAVPDITLPDDPLMIIFVGMPGANKTTYYNKYLSSLVHINQDTLKTKAKVLSEIKNTIAAKSSMVIDATNPIANNRKTFIELAKDAGYQVIIFYFLVNGTNWNALREKPVPTIAYNVYRSKLQEPSLELDDVPVYEIS